jgi:hypothetical protein
MARAQNVKNFEKTTGRSWEDWLKFLEGIGAASMSHTEIANRVFETGLPSGWWAQGITVAYEQHIGRRVPGQVGSEQFSTSVTKTLTGSMDDALDRWLRFIGDRSEFDGVAFGRAPKVSRTEKRRFWRCGLSDGTNMSASFEQRPADKVLMAISHDKIPTEARMEAWRAYWKTLLQDY